MKRYSYLDWLRVFCALAVVAVHVLSHYLGRFPLHSLRWTATMCMKHAMHFCIPGFFMISGALLIKPLGDMSYGHYLKKRFVRICIPFVIWSLVHWLVITVTVQGGDPSPVSFFRLLLSNGISSQYWYVYATLILYLLLPFVGEMVSRLSRKQLKILIWVMVFINHLLPFFNDALKAVSSWKITNYNMSAMGSYLTYALIGYALHMAEMPSPRRRRMIYAAGIASYAAMNISCHILSADKYVSTFVDTKYPLSCLMGVALFIGAKSLFADKRLPRLISVLSAESYTAYLTHMMCLRLLQIRWTSVRVAAMPTLKAAAVMAAEFALGAIGCFGIAWLAHKLPKVSKYL